MHSRRDFMSAMLALGSVVLLTQYQSASAMTSAEPELVLFDPDHASSCRYDCATLPVVGDRVRFARDVFGAPAAPDVVAGVTTYADYILLSGCAAEQGYRVRGEQVQGALVHWKVARRSTCSG